MRAGFPRLTRRTTLWNAWIGFNASHSLGAMLFAAIYLILSTAHMPLLRDSAALVWLAVIASAGYLALAQRYWFRTPFRCIVAALVLYVAALLAQFF